MADPTQLSAPSSTAPHGAFYNPPPLSVERMQEEFPPGVQITRQGQGLASLPQSESGNPAAAFNKSSTEDMTRLVVQKLKTLYISKCRPLERDSYFSEFHYATLTESEIEARPQVLLIGQYSTGKTSFIKWLTNIDSHFFDIRPQPSTDKFTAVVHGDEEKVIKGDAATCLAQLPYRGLSTFGKAFLQRFEALVEPADILESINFIDTPGVLSGDKQRISRGYDFVQVCKWLAQRSDLILLLFDAHKLDISDEFKEVIEAIKPDSDKMRCVLNKADQIDAENLVRVFGALMWSLGKILRTPEVARVYIGSFWEKEYRCKDHEALFNNDRKDVVTELRDLPKNVAVRKINEMVARIRLLKVHMAIVSTLRSKMPSVSLCGSRARRQKWLAEHLKDICHDVQKEHGISDGDLPNLEEMSQKLLTFPDFAKFPQWNPQSVRDLDYIIDVEIPKLMALIGGVSASSLRGERNSSSLANEDAARRLKRKDSSSFFSSLIFALMVVVALAACLIAAGNRTPEPLQGLRAVLVHTLQERLPETVVGRLIDDEL